MKHLVLLTGAAAAVVMISGCRPDLDQGEYGAEEKQWLNIIQSNYSGYRPPRIAPPATVDRATPEALEKQREQQELERQQEADAGKETVSEVTPAAENDAAAADKKEDTAAPADAKKAEADQAAPADAKKAEVDKAAPADAKKAEADKAAPADVKKAEAAPAADADCIIHTVAPGETLGSIARKYYGKASLFEIIVKANPQLKDPKRIRIGTKLSIPKL